MFISWQIRLLMAIAVPWLMWAMGWFDDNNNEPAYFRIGVLVVGLFWGVMLVEPLMALFPALGKLIHHQKYAEWEGKYYKYELTHLRAYFEGDEAWFDADDVLSVLGMKAATWRDTRFTAEEFAVIPGRKEKGFTPAGVVKLTQLSTHPEAAKFRLWFERAVVYTLERKKEKKRIS